MQLARVLVALALIFGPSQAAPAGCGCTNVVITPSEQSCLLGHLLQIITTLVNNQDPKCTKELMRNLTRSCPEPSSTTPKLWKWEEPKDESHESVEEPETIVNKPVPIPLPIPFKASVKKPVSKPEPEIEPEIKSEPKPEVDEKPETIIKPSLLPIPVPLPKPEVDEQPESILPGPLTGPIFKGLEPKPNSNSVQEPETDVKPEEDAEDSPATEPVTEPSSEPEEEREEGKPEEKLESKKLPGTLKVEPEPAKEYSEEAQEGATESLPETTETVPVEESDAESVPSPVWPPAQPSTFGVPLPGLVQKPALESEEKEEKEAVPVLPGSVPSTPIVQKPSLEPKEEDAAPEAVSEPVVATDVPQSESGSDSEADVKPIPFPLLPPVLPPIFGGPLPGLVPPVEKKKLVLEPEGKLDEEEALPEAVTTEEPTITTEIIPESESESKSEAVVKPVPFPLLPPALPPIFGGPLSGLVPPAVEQKPVLEDVEEVASEPENGAEPAAETESEADTKPIPFPLFPPIFGAPLPGLAPPAPVEQKPELEAEDEKAAPENEVGAKPLPLLPGGIFGGAVTEPETESELESDSESKQQPIPLPLFPATLPSPKPGAIFGGSAIKPEEALPKVTPATEISPDNKSDSEESPESESKSAADEEHEHATEQVSNESSASDDKESHETDEVADEKNETTTTKISESTESDETAEDTQSDTEETTEVSATPKPEATTESAETEEVASQESLEGLMKKKDEILAHAHKLLDEAHEMLKLPDKIRAETLGKVKKILPEPEETEEDTSSDSFTTTESTSREPTEDFDSSEETNEITTTEPSAVSTTEPTRKILKESEKDAKPIDAEVAMPSLFPPVISPTAGVKHDAALEPTAEVTESVPDTAEVTEFVPDITESKADSLEHVAKPEAPAQPPLFPPALEVTEPVTEDEKSGADSLEPAAQPIPSLFPLVPPLLHFPAQGLKPVEAEMEDEKPAAKPIPSLFPLVPPLFSAQGLKPAEAETEEEKPAAPMIPPLFSPLPLPLPGSGDLSTPKEEEPSISDDSEAAVLPVLPPVVPPQEQPTEKEDITSEESKAVAPEKPLFPSLFPSIPPLLPAVPNVNNAEEKEVETETLLPETTAEDVEPTEPAVSEDTEALTDIPEKQKVSEVAPKKTILPSIPSLFAPFPSLIPAPISPAVGGEPEKISPEEEKQPETTEPAVNEEESGEVDTVKPDTTEEVPTEALEQAEEPQPAISSFFPSFGNLFTGGKKPAAPPLLPPLGNIFTPNEPKEEKDAAALESVSTTTEPCDLSTSTPAEECATQAILEPKIITSVAPPLLPPLGNIFTPETTEGKDSISTSTMQCDLSTTEPCPVSPYTDLPKIDNESSKVEVPEIHAEMKATEAPKEEAPNMDETFNTAVESTTKAMCEHRPMKYPHTLFIPVLKFDETPAYTADELLEYVYNMYRSPKHGLRIDQTPLKNHEHHKY
nr:unnamed protein product [Callosobruchus chinensis]